MLLLKFVCILQALYSICNSYLSNGCYEGLFSLSVGQQRLSGWNTNSLWFRLSTRICVCVCVHAHKVMCVTGSYKSVWAPEEGGPWPGLPDTGGKAKHWALILIQTHVHLNIHAHKNIPYWPSWINRCFLPSSQIHRASHTHKHTHTARPWHPYRLTQRPL